MIQALGALLACFGDSLAAQKGENLFFMLSWPSWPS